MSLLWFMVVAVPVPEPTKDTKKDLPVVVATPFFEEGRGFNVKSGTMLEKVDGSSLQDLTVDLIWDPPNGLVSNSKECGILFPGKAGIAPIGKTKPGVEPDVAKLRFVGFVALEDIHIGHSYVIRSATGDVFGVLHVAGVNLKRKSLTFYWQRLPKKK